MSPHAAVGIRRELTLFFRGEITGHMRPFLRMLGAARWWRGVSRWRFADRSGWQDLAGMPAWSLLDTERASHMSPSGFWRLELAAAAEADGPRVEIANLPAVRDLERASHVRLRFDDAVESAEIAALGGWVVNELALWWGSAGFVFEHLAGQQNIAHAEMASLAKRYWGVQVLDTSALQWDALAGMPSVNWLQLVGDGFAQAAGFDIDAVTSASSRMLDEGIFHRRGQHGLALAAGAHPVMGDINAGEDLAAYVRMAGLLKPLLLKAHEPLAGPFAKPEVMSAWLQRFSDPQAWLDCDIHAE